MSTRTRLLAGCAATVIVGLLISTQVMSQEKKPPEPPGQKDLTEAMEQWNALNAKGPEHEKFKAMVGKWDTTTKMWMMPGAPPTVSTGTAEFRLILDGRYVEQHYHCEFAGQAFEGLSIAGYDRIRKKYVSIWMDNTSTGIYVSDGTTDATGKVCTYYGTIDDPTTGEHDKVTKSIARELSADQMVFEMYEQRAGVGEVKNMEITYTRKK